MESMIVTIQPFDAEEPAPYPEESSGDVEYHFHILKDVERAGYLCIQDYGDGVCNSYLRILKEYRGKVFSRKFLAFIFNFPFTLGFKEVWTNTTWNSWARILKKFGFEEFFLYNDVKWFRKVI